jgi:hypothetical protein
MGRRNETEKETIRAAADAARAMLPRLLQQRAQLDQRIANLQAVVTVWDAVSGKRLKTDLAVSGADGTAVNPRARKGQVPAHIDEILREGGEYDEPELREAINKRFSLDYKRGTIYTSLRRGFDSGKYAKAGKKWKLNPVNAAQKA